METVLIGLGSNVGDRAAHIRFALKEIARLPKTRLVRSSALHTTRPVGGPQQRDFLNAAAVLRTQLSLMALLIEFKRLEAARGRKPGRRWGPRPLDCDLLFYGRRRCRSRFLSIPHPHALRRRFVLAPLAEIAPDFIAPGSRRTITELLKDLA